MTSIRALVLDVDGVLITGDSARVAFERDHGITPAMTGSFFAGRFIDCLVGKADLKQCLAPLLSDWGWLGSVQTYLDYWFEVESHLDETLLVEVARLRDRGMCCYLATNQERYRTQYLIETLGLGQHFDAVYSSCDLGFTKQEPQFWVQLKHELFSIPPSAMLFWDDTPANVQAARDAGLQAELYTNLDDFLKTTRGLSSH